MSSKSKQGPHREETLPVNRGLLGWLAGLITAVIIAFPLSAAIAYATHPSTRKLFGEHLSNASAAGFATFWWILAVLLAALPFLVGFGISKLSAKWLAIFGVIVVILVIGLIVLGQMFAF
ncbi:hypothetical protein HII28_12700 [Planctomonas sp. JC2975]|uniref:hypothetical protein n=1 Tax=Planctomonas sp. JC2975 TaxID=2729626 RepID=UPI0014730E54|nr:hypothetical protein [Planctomonas sp. JC2975]NNC12733.1 hypothetical protein [Planctomonas sp. JC2975]